MNEEIRAEVREAVADFVAWRKQEAARTPRQSVASPAKQPKPPRAPHAPRSKCTRAEERVRRRAIANQNFVQWIAEHITTETFTGDDLKAAGAKQGTINARLLHAFEAGLLTRENTSQSDVRPRYVYHIAQNEVTP